MKDHYNLTGLKIGSFALAALFSALFWIGLIVLLSGCKVAERVTDISRTHTSRDQRLHLSRQDGQQSAIHSDIIEKAGVLYILDKDHKAYKPGESLQQYAAENSDQILDYNSKEASKDSTGNKHSSTALSSTDRAGSDSAVKHTDHKKDSSAGSMLKSLPWYVWVLSIMAISLVIFFKKR